MRLIGLTGMPGSGKSEAVQTARARGLLVLRMGDLVWDEVERRGLPRSAEHVGTVANEMRATQGPRIWAERTVDRARQAGADTVIIDGVRSLDEVACFRESLGDAFRLVSIVCPTETRYGRMLARGRDDDPDDRQVLVERDERERSWGIEAVIDAADVRIDNAGTPDELAAAFGAILDG